MWQLILTIFTVRNEVAKVMFLQACVCPQGGVPDQVHPPDQVPPPDQVHPRDQVHPPPEIRPLLRTVRILLECILVVTKYNSSAESSVLRKKNTAWCDVNSAILKVFLQTVLLCVCIRASKHIFCLLRHLFKSFNLKTFIFIKRSSCPVLYAFTFPPLFQLFLQNIDTRLVCKYFWRRFQ